jgi:choline monooxygenase
MPDHYVDSDISKAKTFNKDLYLNQDLFTRMKEQVFASTWQLAGNLEQVLVNGKVHPFTLLKNFMDEPLLLTRDKKGEVHCLSNVCTHRGNLLVEHDCTAPNLRCRYHGRVFQLNGTFQAMPEFREVQNFPTEDDNLTKLPLFQWGKLLFTSIHPKFPAEKFFKPLMERLSWLPFEQFSYRADLSKDYVVNAHWALYCENYLEGFHIPFVHADLNAVIDYGNYSTELFEYSNLQLGIARNDEDCFDLPESSPDFGKKVAAYYFWVFPNMMFNFYPWGLSVNVVKPLGLDKTKVSYLTFMFDETRYQRGAGGQLDKVEMEDEAVVSSVQKGIRSRFYKHGRYSVTKEQGTHHFHRILSAFLNGEK